VHTFALVTFGCKVNQYDSQAAREALLRRGLLEVSPSEDADLYVVNTCCVTAESHRKGLKAARRLARRHPNAAIVVAGCSVEMDPERVRNTPGVDAAVDNAEKARLDAIAARILGDSSAQGCPGGASAWPSISRFADHTRAFVKIEDGCNAFCSYCIVPHVRGRVRSRAPDEVVDEVARLAEGGYHEVVLTGIHLGAYGTDAGGESGLLPLLERLEDAPGLERLRLSSLELGEVTDELLDLMAASERLCPHLHIPLQSGDDAVLRAMNRHYTAEEFLGRLAAIRSHMPDAAVTTDAIVGFPGETDEHFQATVKVCRRAAFSRMHVFPYSDRPGTRAAAMPGKLDRPTIQARRDELLAVAAELAEGYHRHFVGRTVEALVESRRDRRTGLLCGYSRRYVRAYFEGGDDLMGELVPVEVEAAEAGGVRGRPATARG
jgi:threonylcarbamoyladenosine tRNA methylthiotransferase MtaB